MSDEFDDIVANYGERPETPIFEGREGVAEMRAKFEEWAEGRDENVEDYPTPIHQTMLSKSLLLELAAAPMFEHLIPPDGEEGTALFVTQLVYTGMSLAALAFDGDVNEGLDELAQIFETLAEILRHDPIVRVMAVGGQREVQIERERLAHNERQNDE